MSGRARISGVLATAALALALSVFPGEGSGRAAGPDAAGEEPGYCTEVGCDSGVSAVVTQLRKQLPEARFFELCMNGKCQRARRPDLMWVRDGSIKNERRVRVKLVARDKHSKRIYRDRVRVKLRKIQPNGPDCPPTCYICLLKVDRETLELRRLGR